MDKVFVDSDVILDFVLDRQPYAGDTACLLSLAYKKKIQLCTTALVFANALQKYAAIESKAQAIVTRNLQDYKLSNLPVMSPHAYLTQLNVDKTLQP